MENKIQQLKNTPEVQEEGILLWDLVLILLRNWKIILIITLIIGIIGTGVAFTAKEKSQYLFNQKVICSEYNYYPIDFDRGYGASLEEYINEKYDDTISSNISVQMTKDAEIYYLDVKYINMTYDEAMNITQDIIDRHNSILDAEYDRLIDSKKEEVKIATDEYTVNQNEYYDFLHGLDGYYRIHNELITLQESISNSKTQIKQYETYLEKISSGTPLLLSDVYPNSDIIIVDNSQTEEIIENDYSAENIEKQIEFENNKLQEESKAYDEANSTYREMSNQNYIMKSKRDNTLNLLSQKELELSKLKYDLMNIEEYYIDIVPLTTVYKDNRILSVIIAFMLGFILSIVFVFVRMSYKKYIANQAVD